ncbi:MAG: RagB/SusD family nutrient uptake outer membrane protein [Bacteroidota bacterium]|nr:RagB/SusD family nutrient uptake outer membrane protein [Bacteroidota bacterium]
MWKNLRIIIIQIILVYTPATLIFESCKKLVVVSGPNTALTSDNVYTNDQTASAVLTGLYELMSQASVSSGTSVDGISIACGLSSDELSLYGGAQNGNQRLAQYFLNHLNSGTGTSGDAGSIWGDLYSKIYTVNLAIERLEAADKLSVSVKTQLLGEAKFMRAFFYFYLTNLYGEVPLTTSSDYQLNSQLHRSPQSQVYSQIIGDLLSASSLLSTNYVGSDAKTLTTERCRPNKWTATALLSRVYLYNKQYDSAEITSTSIINNSLYGLDSLNNVFLKNSHEAIWQLQPVNPGWNTEDAKVFLLPINGPTLGPGYPVYISSLLLHAFEPQDRRRASWIDSVGTPYATVYYFPYKYKSATLNAPVTEYLMVFRLGEQFLIRSEARAKQNELTLAENDLNAIRVRAGLDSIKGSNMNSLLYSIMHERQVELFTEWGNRWFDLQRSGWMDSVMQSAALSKGTTWNENAQLFPVPLYDIIQNPNISQNVGY